MPCLRCGRETENDQVFCVECETQMARHPVKPNTVVTIPERSIRMRTTVPRRQPKPEENTEHLHRTIMQLRLWVCMLMAALILCVAALTCQTIQESREPAIGQNYTSIVEQGGGGR